MKISQQDYQKYYQDKHDDGFSPNRNKFIVEGTIRKYETNRLKKINLFTDSVRERANAISFWLKSRHGAESNNPIERYFTPKELAHLRGEEIINQLRMVGKPTFTPKDIIQAKPITKINGEKKQ